MGVALPDHLRVRAECDGRGSVVQCHDSRFVPVAADLTPIEGVSLREGGVIGACALFVTTAEDGGAGLAAPPPISWELRGTFGRFSETITGASGAIVVWPDGWSSRGSVVFVSGRFYEGLELWARSTGAGPVRLMLRWLVVSGGGEGAPSITAGKLG